MSNLEQRLAQLSPEQKAQLRQRLRQNSSAPPPPTIPHRDRTQPAPLSFTQQRLWFLNQLDPDSASYHNNSVVRIPALVQVEQVQQTLRTIAQRHESLRITVQVQDEQPVQVVQALETLPFEFVDLRSLPLDDREGECQQQMQQRARQRFDWARQPLWRSALFQLDEQEFVLLLTLHHLISDGWSKQVFWQEFGQIYQALQQHRPLSLPELLIQFPDFAQWQQSAAPESTRAGLAYWIEKLSQSESVLELPSDRPHPPLQSLAGQWHPMMISAPVTGRLKAIAQEENATLFMILLAGFNALLHRYTRQEDILVGIPIANRPAPETHGLIGFFANTLALRTDLSGNPKFRNLLRRVRETALEAYSHQSCPFEKVVEALRPDRQLSRSPLIQVMLAFQNTTPPSLTIDDQILKPFQLDIGISKLDLTLELRETAGELTGYFEYNTDIFDAATIERLTQHFQILLAGIAQNPDCPLAELPLLSPSERHQLLVEWNQTQIDLPSDRFIHELISEQCQRTPEAIAVELDDRTLTYGELDRRANQLARSLQQWGVQPETLVGICVERSLEMVIGLLGILKAGGAYLPLDPSYPADRLSFMMSDADLSIVLTQALTRDRLPASTARFVILDADWPTIAQASTVAPAIVLQPDHLIYVIYTSGSTGKPKGAMNTHRALSNLLLWMQAHYQFTAADRVLQKTPLSFDPSVWEVFLPLMVGARLTLAAPEGHKDPVYLRQVIADRQITAVGFVPAMLQVFLDGTDCPGLRRVFCGGEVLSPSLVQRCSSQLSAELHNFYGPSEAASCCTSWDCNRLASKVSVPIGRPVGNTQIYILDAWLQPVPIGVVGELHIGGAALGRGYLNRTELTAEKFIPHRFSTQSGDRLYKTGDLARFLPDGTIEFLGRLDDQVKVRGFRIEPGEIEQVLEQHPQVEAAAVVPLVDRQGNLSLVAYLAAPSTPPSQSELRQFLRLTLPDYMIPGAFVLMPTLPLTPNGKLDRKALPEPDGVSSCLGSPPAAQTQVPTALEQQLIEIWQQVLGVPSIGLQDNFFDLGGHSLLAVTLLARIEQTLGKKISLVTLFYTPTLQQIAQVLQQDTPTTQVNPAINAAQSHQPPLFLFEPSPGELAALARNLNLDRPLHILGTGSFEITDPTTHIKTWAARSFQEIRTVQPQGPYFLSGYCMGGLVALEVAQHLRTAGEEVALLALIETEIRGTPPSQALSSAPPAPTPVEVFKRRKIANLSRHLTNLKKLNPTQKLAYIWQHILYLTQAIADRWPDAVSEQEKIRRSVVALGKQAVWNYSPDHAYNGQIVFFLSQINRDSRHLVESSQERFARSGCQPIVLGVPILYLVPGDHWSLVREPNVEVLCRQIEQHL